MNTIKKSYDDLPEMVTIEIPKNLVHRKAEIFIITEESDTTGQKSLLDYFGLIPDFPERFPQGEFEMRAEF